MSARDPRDLLRSFAPPRASEALRGRVLAASRVAVALAVRPARTDRIWYSTAWRLAWVGALAALIVLETLSMRGAGGNGRSGRSEPAAIPESAAAAEALGLPGHGWLGQRAVTDDDPGRILAEEAL